VASQDRVPPPPPGAADRRRDERLDLLAQIEVRRMGGDVSILPVGNISAGGIFLKLEPGLSLDGVMVGEPVTLFIDLSSLGDDLTLSGEAVVARIDRGGPGRNAGFALMWTSTDAAFSEKLATVLKRLAAPSPAPPPTPPKIPLVPRPR
jgi:hypothetical protein